VCVCECGDDDHFNYQGRWSRKSYKLLLSTSYRVLNLVVCTLLLLLAVMEQPNVGDEAVTEDEQIVFSIVSHYIYCTEQLHYYI